MFRSQAISTRSKVKINNIAQILLSTLVIRHSNVEHHSMVGVDDRRTHRPAHPRGSFLKFSSCGKSAAEFTFFLSKIGKWRNKLFFWDHQFANEQTIVIYSDQIVRYGNIGHHSVICVAGDPPSEFLHKKQSVDEQKKNVERYS